MTPNGISIFNSAFILHPSSFILHPLPLDRFEVSGYCGVVSVYEPHHSIDRQGGAFAPELLGNDPGVFLRQDAELAMKARPGLSDNRRSWWTATALAALLAGGSLPAQSPKHQGRLQLAEKG